MNLQQTTVDGHFTLDGAENLVAESLYPVTYLGEHNLAVSEGVWYEQDEEGNLCADWSGSLIHVTQHPDRWIYFEQSTPEFALHNFFNIFS